MDLSEDDSDLPTASEALLFLTLPASAAPLSSALMPRRHRERILEITKTVTVTEVVNNSPRCHPGTCEVTVTNVESGSGHPVSVNISHMHEKMCEDRCSGASSPVVHVKEFMKDETRSGTIEKITSTTERILKVETGGDITFGERGDNVIDLNFTYPLSKNDIRVVHEPNKTLFYHSYEKESSDVGNDLLSPDSAVSDSPKRYMRSDDSDSDSGSLVIHSPVGRADSGVSSTAHHLNGKNLSISVGSSEEDDLRYTEPLRSPQPGSVTGQRLPVYIVTGKSETPNSERSRSTATLFADIEASANTSSLSLSAGPETKSSSSMTSLDREEERKRILVVTNVASTLAEEIVESAEEEAACVAGSSGEWSDTLPGRRGRSRLTMEVLFTPPTPLEKDAPPKPPRRAKYGPIQLVEHVQHYECPMDELSEGPIITSTPMNTLERPPRKSAEERKRLREFAEATEESSPDETPILTPPSRKTSRTAKPPALEPVTPENSLEQPVPSPRRSPSSPIIVVDQERKSSMDLLVPPKQPRRKSTVTDIDWFAAFNMKEPTTPKSPRSPLPIDALREAENMMIERKRPAQPVKPLTPSNIDLDDVFACTAQSKKEDKNCACNACALMKMSEEELRMRVAAARRSPTPERRQVVENIPLPEPSRRNIYEDSDISMDDIFSAPTTKKIEPTTSDLQEKAEDEPVHRLDVDPVQTAEIENPAEVLATSDAPDDSEAKYEPVHRLHVDPPILTAEIEIPAEVLDTSDAKVSAQERTATAFSSAAFPTNAEGLSLASQFISSTSALPQEPLADEGKDQATQTEHKVMKTSTTTTATVENADTKWLEQLLSEPVNEEELKQTVQQLHDVVVAENADIMEQVSFKETPAVTIERKEESVQVETKKVLEDELPAHEEVVASIAKEEVEPNPLKLDTSADIGYESQDLSATEKEIEKKAPLPDSIVDLDDIFRPIQEKKEEQKKNRHQTLVFDRHVDSQQTVTPKTIAVAEISQECPYVIESTKYEPILVPVPRDFDEEAKSPAKLKTFDFENIKEVFEESEAQDAIVETKEEKKAKVEEQKVQESLPSTSDVSWLTDIVSSRKEEQAHVIPMESVFQEEVAEEKVVHEEDVQPKHEKRASVSESEEECLPSTSTVNDIVEEPHKMETTVLPLEQPKLSAAIFSLDWIESMIKESQETQDVNERQKHEDNALQQETPAVDDILRLVFETPCESLDRGKTCPCSACALSKLSSEELKRFWRKVQERQSEVVVPSTAELDTQDKGDAVENVKPATIDLEDVFGNAKPKERLAEAKEFTSESVVVSEASQSERIYLKDTLGHKSEKRELKEENKPVVDTHVTNEEINLEAVFGERQIERQEPSTEQVSHSPSPSDSPSAIPVATTQSVDLDSSVGHSETTADSWILSVIKNDAEAPIEQFQFDDSFELSYLASIREEEKQTRDQVTTYNNYYREEVSEPATPQFEKSSGRRHVDDYYDEPEEEEFSLSGNINVEDLVDDILNSSLNEAALVAATRNFKREESRHTDTSYDRKPADTTQSMYLATAGSESLMESILSLATPPATEPAPTFDINTEKFVSEASVVLSESPSDDYIIRLVFANSDNGKKEEPVESLVMTESEIPSPTSDEIREVTVLERTETTSKSFYSKETKTVTTQRSMSRSDEEILEVEVNPEHYLIKGSYSVVINKTDLLGVLLSELQADTTALDFALTPKLRRLLLQCLREKARPNEGKTLSSRARHLVTRTDPAYDVFYQMNCNRYSADNPTGNINFCTAENNICKDLIEERFRKDPEVYKANSDHVTHYGPPGGYPEVKKALSKYLKDEYNADVDNGNVVLLPSGNATYDLVCHCLFDSDDVVITNAPTYSRNFINVAERAQCILKSVPLNLDDPKISVVDFEKSFQEYSEQGDNVRAVVLINPHNPLGIVFPVEDIMKLATWTAERNLWLIVDESFAQCVHDDNITFTSFVEYQMSLSTKSVWFWGLSKDFGLPGVKLNMAQTNDRDLYKALCQIELTEPVSALAQDFVVNFLSDREWLNQFKAEKKRRLRAHYEFAVENLRALAIPFVEASSGIFVFVDFRKKLSSQSEAGEEELWRALTAKGIFMTPGMHTKSSQPGWMRLVFACDKEQVREGFRRLHEFFDSKRNVRELSY